MAENSSIEWTDATWNPVRGCTKISPGCAHCYAETFAERFRGVPGHPYEQGFDLRLVPEKLAEPLHWKKPRMVFVNSMSDVFHEDVPDEYIDQVFAVMAVAHWHTFQVLTKRAKRLRDYFADPARYGRMYSAIAEFGSALPSDGMPHVLTNVWVGVSVEDQRRAGERIPHLRQTPAAVRFLSVEPLLQDLGQFDLDGIGWCIVGGESGGSARRCDLGWIRSVVAQCRDAGVPCFVKQLGSNPYKLMCRKQNCSDDACRDYLSLKDRKGGDPDEWPSDLQVREFPKSQVPA